MTQPGKSRAECLECGFKISPRSEFQFVIFDAERHGRITQLDCSKRDEAMLITMIKGIREGTIERHHL